MDINLIYYTDNCLDETIANFCRKNILEAADGKPIISVSQKPLDFGENICVGDIGRNHLSIFKQILVGTQSVKTKYVALVEHDCLYTKEHFNWTPHKDYKFFYNTNHWIVNWKTGEYLNMGRRKVLSQMICDRELLLKGLNDKISMLEIGAKILKGQSGACEFGVISNNLQYDEYEHYYNILKSAGKDLGSYSDESFSTVNPNLDIRHGHNFTGNKKSRNRCFEIPYWGKFSDIMESKE